MKKKFGFNVEIDVESETEFQMENIYNVLNTVLFTISRQYKGTEVKADFSSKGKVRIGEDKGEIIF